LLLAVPLYWGWQFVQTGWGKMHHIAKITGFLMSLHIPLLEPTGKVFDGRER
jgi:putative oxidoreductase